MLWEAEIRPKDRDPERGRVCEEYDLLTQSQQGRDLIGSSSRGYLLQGELGSESSRQALAELLVDPLVELIAFTPLNEDHVQERAVQPMLTVLLKPGVMDPTAQSVLDVAHDLGIPLQTVS